MSTAGERLIRAAEQALAYAEGRAEPGSFREHRPGASDILIRPEEPGDIQTIHAIERAAFDSAIQPKIVDDLREAGALWLSHVAILDGEIAGHCAYSLATIDDGETIHDCLALGPIAVHPAHQGAGIGGAMIRAGIAALRQAGVGLLFLVGSPDYYPRFGFQAALPLGFTSDYVEDSNRHEHFMVFAIDERLIGKARGHMRFHAAFEGH